MVQKSVLIITPFSDFSDLLSESIARDESYTVASFSTVKAVANHIYSNDSLHYALLDVDVGFGKLKECIFIIRDRFPDAEIILISRKKPPKEMEELRPWRLLRKPFIESDLLELFNNPRNFEQSQVIDGVFQNTQDGIPIWATDKNELQKILLRTVTELDVVDAFIYSRDGVLAQTDKISDNDLSDCTWTIQRYLNGSEQGEILKQIHLTSNTYLLHVTILAIGIILAILYNEDIPYRIVRDQTRYLTGMILNPRLFIEGKLHLPERAISTQVEKIDQSDSEDYKEEIVPLNQNKRHPRPSRKFRRAIIEKPEEEMKNEPREEETNPASENHDDDLDQGLAFEPPPGIDQDRLADAWSFQAPEPDPISAAANESRWVKEAEPEGVQPMDSGNPLNQYSTSKMTRRENEYESEHGKEAFLPPAQGLSYLNYACLLIPRLKSCLIANDLARFLNDEIPNIFLAYGWRLENLFIDKHYLQWIVRLPSSIAPSNHIRTIRKESSKMILGNFARLSKDGLITDYWAPGFLLESGKQPIPGNEIRDFIQANRELYYPDKRIFHIQETNYSPAKL